MSKLRHGDGELHYSDNSHRWLRPYDEGPAADEIWRQRVEAHVEEHRRHVGGPIRPARVPRGVAVTPPTSPPRVPPQRAR